MLTVIWQVVIDKGHRELLTLPCINSPVEAVAKVQSQEGVNICLLTWLCGCHIGTHPPGTHSLQTDRFFRTASNNPLATVLKTLVPIAKAFEASLSLQSSPRVGPGGREGWQETWPGSQVPALHLRAASGCSCYPRKMKVPVFAICHFYSLQFSRCSKCVSWSSNSWQTEISSYRTHHSP